MASATIATRPRFEPRRQTSRKKEIRKKRPRFDFLAAFGEILITLGFIGLLFGAWQIWVTDMQVAGNTQALINSFADSNRNYPQKISDDERTTPPPPFTPVGHGEMLGVLHVPTWKYMVFPIREGTTPDVLDTGAAGHYIKSQQPGEIGNFAIAAHRRSYGSSFRRIDTLGPGDVMVVETDKAWLVYHYDRHQIVHPSANEVVAAVPGLPGAKPTIRYMTMTTCHPEYGNSQRYIVHSKFHHWVPKNTGIPKELADEGLM